MAHWLTSTAAELLSEHSNGQARFDSLTLRCFVFHEGSLLLVRMPLNAAKPGGWGVPSEVSWPEGDSTPGLDPDWQLRECAVYLLAAAGLPREFLGELQFMEFGQEEPLFLELPETGQLQLFVVLTTLRRHHIPLLSESEPAQAAWASYEEAMQVQVTSLDSTPGAELHTLDLANAFLRYQMCFKEPRMDFTKLQTTCEDQLSSMILAQRGTAMEGYDGLIAIEQQPGGPISVLAGPRDDTWTQFPYTMNVYDIPHWVIGRFEDGILEWRAHEAPWEYFLTANGRIAVQWFWYH